MKNKSISNENTPVVDTVSVVKEQGETVATWTWSEDFEYSVCAKFFYEYRDIIMKLDAPFIYHDEAARLFMLGCSYGDALKKVRDDLHSEILRVASEE